MKKTLLVLAAGMGSRYGGLKQIDPVGPSGETILDYSMYDAVKAGFDKIVFVIRRQFQQQFKERIGDKLKDFAQVEYAYQELESFTGDFDVPADRVKPWGTGHAVLVTKDLIDEPFAMINADDFYGSGAFKVVGEYLSSEAGVGPEHYAMVGYELRNTLSDFGSVSRGICKADENMLLQDIVETEKIEKSSGGAQYPDAKGNIKKLSGSETVSMNLWGFHPSIFSHISTAFQAFLSAHGSEPKSEIYIPFVVDELIKTGKVSVKVLETSEKWFGVTYKDDMPSVQAGIQGLIEKGVYPKQLWD